MPAEQYFCKSGVDSEGVGGVVKPPIDTKFHFSWEVFGKFDKFGILYLPLIFTSITLFHIFPSSKPILLLMNVCLKMLDEWQTV